jgi:hypothetical protein
MNGGFAWNRFLGAHFAVGACAVALVFSNCAAAAYPQDAESTELASATTQWYVPVAATMYFQDGKLDEAYKKQRILNAKGAFALQLEQMRFGEYYNELVPWRIAWSAPGSDASNGGTEAQLESEIKGVFPNCPADAISRIVSSEPIWMEVYAGEFITKLTTTVYDQYGRYQSEYVEKYMQAFGAGKIFCLDKMYIVTSLLYEYKNVNLALLLSNKSAHFLVVEYDAVEMPMIEPISGEVAEMDPSQLYLGYPGADRADEYFEDGSLRTADLAYTPGYSYQIFNVMSQTGDYRADEGIPELLTEYYWQLKSVEYTLSFPPAIVYSNRTAGADASGGNRPAIEKAILEFWKKCPTDVIGQICDANPDYIARGGVTYESIFDQYGSDQDWRRLDDYLALLVSCGDEYIGILRYCSKEQEMGKKLFGATSIFGSDPFAKMSTVYYVVRIPKAKATATG